ncbi:ABC transporter permease [Actinoplanes utahensis]|uniref:Macrolide ABC transporter permease n=1 Tax=Actinoplanes utahensis TaxID=1869 RepID=A0A0A6UDX4_ACTUT|nr:ABC transporter permease [Actinoplanes utahensis]KHD73263.1 macrolide ABC transporter permease [Actinoplanes utahensis]GIF27458.1 peptide ABC transporter permease [Actinoplanes utahensis]
MNFVEVVRFALRGLSANKLRSALTMLGILIGVAAVILLVAVGNGSAKAISDRIEALGTNTITVMSTGRGGSSSTSLTRDMADALVDAELAPDVRSVSPVVSSSSATMTYEGADHAVATFVGTTPAWFTASSTPVGRGTGFTSDDVDQGRRVVVIGQTVAEELFGGIDPIGEQVTVGGALFTVVGVLEEKTSTGFQDADDTAVAPLTAVQQVLTGYGPLTSIIVEANDPDDVDAVQSQVATILNQRLDVPESSGSTPYRIQNASSLLETQTETADTFTTLLGVVAAISLLVGGIGITNIMLVTVTERTREIGIRKALGAPRRVILTQFLIEASLLSVLGGALGVAAALIGARFEIVGVTPVIVPSSIGYAVGVSIAIGLFFGGLPAARAARLRPIDALRYE